MSEDQLPDELQEIVDNVEPFDEEEIASINRYAQNMEGSMEFVEKEISSDLATAISIYGREAVADALAVEAKEIKKRNTINTYPVSDDTFEHLVSIKKGLEMDVSDMNEEEFREEWDKLDESLYREAKQAESQIVVEVMLDMLIIGPEPKRSRFVQIGTAELIEANR